MNWWQLLLTILGSGSLTAIITGSFNWLSNKQNNKYNQKRFEEERKMQKEKEDKIKQIEKARDLLRIIKQGQKCVYLFSYNGTGPTMWHRDAWNDYYEKLINENITYNHEGKKLINFLDKQIYCRGDIPLSEYFLRLMKNDLDKDILDFRNRYFTYDKNNFINGIDFKKLNEDIDFVNEILNLNIEKYKGEKNNED